MDWMFVDLAKVRQARLIDLAIEHDQVVHLPDGSSFLWISADDLYFVGAIVRATFAPTSHVAAESWQSAGQKTGLEPRQRKQSGLWG